MRVFILKQGKEYNQGVAYLDEGTMAVDDNVRKMISKTIAIAVLALPVLFWAEPIFGAYKLGVFGVPSAVAFGLVAGGIALLGLVWMIRVFRGPRDGPRPWRYRDR